MRMVSTLRWSCEVWQDEASKVRAGETSEPAESNEASEVSEDRGEDMALELVEAKASKGSQRTVCAEDA